MRSSPPAPTPPATPTIRLRSPGEIVSAVPYLLGFAPQASLVLIGLHGKRMVLTCRADLEDVDVDPCAEAIEGALTRASAERALLVAYASDRDVGARALAVMTERLAGAGITVPEQISVVGDRWFGEDCADERCCPSEGVPVADHDEAPSTMDFHAHSGGYRPDRAALVAECHPDRPLLVAGIRSEIGILVGTDRDIAEDDIVLALRAVLGWGGPGDPTPAQLALAAVAVADPLVRDACYAVVAPGMLGDYVPDLVEVHVPLRAAGTAAGDLDGIGVLLDGDARDRVLRRLLAWVRNLPDDVPGAAMPALVVAAAAHWCAGDGARARILVERAHALDAAPLPMLETLSSAIAHGFRPPGYDRLSTERPGDGLSGRFIA